MQKHRRMTFCIIWFSILVLPAGCAGLLFKNYGEISPNKEVTKAFETYQINT